MAVDIERVHRHFGEVKNERMPWDNLWRMTAPYYQPTSADWTGSTMKTDHAWLKGTKSYDDTPSWAANRFASALMSLLMDPTESWLDFMVVPTSGVALSVAVERYLQRLRDVSLYLLQEPSVGFYEAMHEHLLDYVIFGESCMFMDKTPDGLPRFTPYPLVQCYIHASDGRTPDTVYRRYEMTVQAIIDRFNRSGDSVPEQVTKKAEAGKWTDTITIIHGVFPRKHGVAGSFATNKPWASIYYTEDKKQLMRESGFDLFPFSTPRFLVFAGKSHGQGPGTLSLANVRTLNTIIKTMLRSDQRKAGPAWIAQRRGWLKPLDFRTDRINYFDGFDMDKSLMPIGTEGQPQAGRDWVQDFREQILRAFYIDRLGGVDKRAEVKEAEVMAKQQENMRDLVPQQSRLHSESVTRIIEFVVGIAKDLIGPPPPELENQLVKLHYLSPIAKSQKLLELNNVARTLQQYILPLGQQDPSILKTYDSHKLSQFVYDKANFPASVLVPEEQFRQEQEQDNQAAQLGQGVEQLKGVSETVKNFSQAQQDTPNPLQGLI